MSTKREKKMQESNTITEKFVIERNIGYESILEPLIRKILGVSEGRVSAGCDFENDKVILRKYYIGDCTCVYGEKYKDFCTNNSHDKMCFQSYLQEINNTFRQHPKYKDSIHFKAERVNLVKSLCDKNNIPFGGKIKLDEICSCSFKSKWEILNVTHDENCPIVLPNLHYLPEDIKIWWYNNFFRDAHCNVELSLDKFKEIVRNVLSSL